MPPPPQGGGGGGGGGGQDNSLAPLWISIAIFVAIGIVWIYAHDYIVAGVFAIRRGEAILVSLFVPSAWSEALLRAQEFMRNTPINRYSAVSATDLAWLSEQIGNYLRYPVLIILGGLCTVLFFSDPTQRFRKSYDMRRLMNEEKINWPQIVPVSKLNLVEEKLDEGPWAMSTPPMDFGKKYNLLVEDQPPPGSAILRTKTIRTATVNKEEARKIFAMQLGAYWTRVEDLPLHTQALFAVFAARIGQDRDGAQQLLKQLARSTGSGQLDFAGVKQLLAKHKDHKRIIKITEQHAFVLTVMASMLQTARQDGVLACADFLWLKPIDRPLWFMLNCVGRQTAFPEISGAYAHWLAEKLFGSRLNIPMVEEAVNGLEAAVKEFIYKPDVVAED